MSSPTETWLHYEQSFIRVIEQAESRDQIEKYYYKFTEYLSTQNHSIHTIEAMKPMIQSTMIHIIKKKFVLTNAVLLPRSEGSKGGDPDFPLFMGHSDDIITLETDISTYNKMIKWVQKENNLIQKRIIRTKGQDGPSKKMWLKAVP